MSWLIVWSTNGVLTNGFWCPPSTETMSERKQEWCFASPTIQGSPRILASTTKKYDAGAKNAPGRNLHQSFDIAHHLAAGATSKAGFQNEDSTTMLILFKDSTISKLILFLNQGQEDGGRWRPMRPLFHIRSEIGTIHCLYSKQQKMLRPPRPLYRWLGLVLAQTSTYLHLKLKSRAIMCIFVLQCFWNKTSAFGLLFCH